MDLKSKLIEEIEGLSEDEMKKLLEVVRDLKAKRNLFKMASEGLVRLPLPPPTSPPRHSPIRGKGKPLSQIVVEMRR